MGNSKIIHALNDIDRRGGRGTDGRHAPDRDEEDARCRCLALCTVAESVRFLLRVQVEKTISVFHINYESNYYLGYNT